VCQERNCNFFGKFYVAAKRFRNQSRNGAKRNDGIDSGISAMTGFSATEESIAIQTFWHVMFFHILGGLAVQLVQRHALIQMIALPLGVSNGCDPGKSPDDDAIDAEFEVNK